MVPEQKGEKGKKDLGAVRKDMKEQRDKLHQIPRHRRGAYAQPLGQLAFVLTAGIHIAFFMQSRKYCFIYCLVGQLL